MKTLEQRLAELGYTLPAVFPRMGSYELFARVGNLLYLSGAAPKAPSGEWMIGKVGAEFSAEEAYEHARYVGLQHLAVMQKAVGDLDQIKRVIKVLGMVNAAPEFTQYTQVINGYSDLLIQVLSDTGKHARSAVGMAGLPGNVSVEIEAIVEVV
jgi:enamine deaminase RidA (YjgF/YER057c/UK114 family)